MNAVGKGEKFISLWKLCNDNVHVCCFSDLDKKAQGAMTQRIVESGMKFLVRTNDVILDAPETMAVKKPSGNSGKSFILAGKVARTEPQLIFVSQCLRRELEKSTPITAVYIDTMAIYSYVQAAINDSQIPILSFHSYSGIQHLGAPVHSVAIISASTTGNMANELKKYKFDAIITLICFDSTSTAICKLEEPAKPQGNEYILELHGEWFTAKAAPPKSVVLRKCHQPKSAKKVLANCDIVWEDDSTLNWTIKLMMKDKTFAIQEFVEEKVNWLAPRNTDLIINVGESTVLQEYVRKTLGEVSCVSYKQPFGNPNSPGEKVSSCKACIITADFIRNGGILRDLARNIRLWKPLPCPCLFLIGIALPKTQKHFQSLEQFLKRNSTLMEYKIATFACLPIGVPRCIPPQIRNNLSKSPGFVFFDGDTPSAEDTLPHHYLIMSAALQAARDHTRDPKNQLQPTAFQPAVLAAECFLRYNDSFLQCAILFAAEENELNYQASPEDSRLAYEILFSLASSGEDEQGLRDAFRAALNCRECCLKLAAADERRFQENPTMIAYFRTSTDAQ